MEQTIQLQGRVRSFVDTLPMDSISNLSGNDLRVYLYCWIDPERGEGGHVHYAPRDIAGDPTQTPVHDGEFSFPLKVRDKDPDLLKVLCCMRMKDEESRNTKNYTLAVSATQLDRLVRGEEQAFTMYDQFNPSNYTEVCMGVANPVQTGITFTRSALWDIESDFKSVATDVSNNIMNNIVMNRMQTAEGGEVFTSGLTSWEFGGAKFEKSGAKEIPPLITHYTLMNHQEVCLKRKFPLAIVAHQIYLRLLHSGMTAEEALKLDDFKFSQFISESCHITRDAHAVSYQGDMVPGLSFTMDGRFGIRCRGTENMGMPCGAPQFLGRALRPIATIDFPRKTNNMKELKKVMEDSLVRQSITGLRPLLTLANSNRPSTSNALCEVDLSILKDDCESEAELATLCRLALASAPETPNELRQVIGSWSLFRNFTPKCYDLMSQLVRRGGGLLRSGKLKIAVSTGLTTNANPTMVAKNSVEYSGHCFNVGCFDDQEKGLQFFLLEGTTPSISRRTTKSCPQVAVKMKDTSGASSTKLLPFNDYCNALAGGINELTRVINTVRGGGRTPLTGGWPLMHPDGRTKLKLPGWTCTEMVMNSLDSDRDCYLEFYNRIMYMGWQTSDQSIGCMPVVRTPGSPQLGGFLTGCHPYDLTNQHLQAIGAVVPDAKLASHKAIMNEAHPPLASEQVFKHITDCWAPCSPLVDVNAQERFLAREPGVEYIRIACMETPAIPEFTPLVCRAKHVAFQLAGEINAKRADSDGVLFVSSDQPQCTGFHGYILVPVRAANCTAIDSMHQALARLEWVGCEPAPKP